MIGAGLASLVASMSQVPVEDPIGLAGSSGGPGGTWDQCRVSLVVNELGDMGSKTMVCSGVLDRVLLGTESRVEVFRVISVKIFCVVFMTRFGANNFCVVVVTEVGAFNFRSQIGTKKFCLSFVTGRPNVSFIHA